jgi:hypothetical protein
MPSNVWLLRKLAGLACVLALGASSAGAQDDAIDWQNAASCVDHVCSMRGTIADQKDDGPVIRLYFDATRRDVYLTLMRGWFVTWPSYVGHTIVATGPVDQFQGAFEMILRTPDSIVVLDAPLTPTPSEDSPTAAPTQTATRAPTSAPTDVPTTLPTAMPPTALPTAVVAPSAAAQDAEEVDQLRQRVKELEERVRQLEGAH